MGLATVAVAMARRSRSGNTTAVRAEVPDDGIMMGEMETFKNLAIYKTWRFLDVFGRFLSLSVCFTLYFFLIPKVYDVHEGQLQGNEGKKLLDSSYEFFFIL